MLCISSFPHLQNFPHVTGSISAGMMILIGKHQFTVSSIADEQPDTIDHIIASVGSTRAAADDDAAWIQAAQQLVKEISAASTFSPQKEDIEER